MKTKLAAFTLLELIIVLFIVGLGWFSFLPKMDIASKKGGDTSIESMNAFLQTIKEQAEKSYMTQSAALSLGSATLTWGDKEKKFSSPILSCKLIDQPFRLASITYLLKFYPDGHSDRVMIALEDGGLFVLDPLAVKFTVAITDTNES